VLRSSHTQIRKQGHAVKDGEQELGSRSVAVPIKKLPFAAAPSISGSSGRITTDKIPLIWQDLKYTAKSPPRVMTSK
jgi:IclR family acetate operon transcriptional repressor